MYLTIDRFEGGLAVCETDGGRIEIDLSLIPKGAKEGDVIEQKCGRYIPAEEETRSRKSKIIGLINGLIKE